MKNEKLKECAAEVTDCFKRSNNNVRKAAALLSRANSLSQAGAEEIVFSKNSLKYIVSLSADVVKGKYQTGDLNIKIETPDNDEIYGVKDRLIDIMENIISNAYIATVDKLEVVSDAERLNYAPQIEIKLIDNGSMHRLSIKDNGIGIRETNWEKVFSPFHSAGSSFIRSGIGMYVVKSMVEGIHNGKIWFETVFKQGTTIFIELPKAEI